MVVGITFLFDPLPLWRFFTGCQEKFWIQIANLVMGSTFVNVKSLVKTVVQWILNQLATSFQRTSRHINDQVCVRVFNVTTSVYYFVVVTLFYFPVAFLVGRIDFPNLEVSIIKKVKCCILRAPKSIYIRVANGIHLFEVKKLVPSPTALFQFHLIGLNFIKIFLKEIILPRSGKN